MTNDFDLSEFARQAALTKQAMEEMEADGLVYRVRRPDGEEGFRLTPLARARITAVLARGGDISEVFEDKQEE